MVARASRNTLRWAAAPTWATRRRAVWESASRTRRPRQPICPHTLNNTVVAPPRMLIAFLENNLNDDGSVRIPEPLRMYMGGKDVIRP